MFKPRHSRSMQENLARAIMMPAVLLISACNKAGWNVEAKIDIVNATSTPIYVQVWAGSEPSLAGAKGSGLAGDVVLSPGSGTSLQLSESKEEVLKLIRTSPATTLMRVYPNTNTMNNWQVFSLNQRCRYSVEIEDRDNGVVGLRVLTCESQGRTLEKDPRDITDIARNGEWFVE